MLFFEVDGNKPGNEISITQDSNSIRVNARAELPNAKAPVEIIFNGKVIHEGTDIDTIITLNDSGWLAARCEGAHSNPVWINMEGSYSGHSAPALRFIGIIDKLEQWVKEKALFDSETQKREVLTVLNSGRLVYEQIVAKAEEFNK